MVLRKGRISKEKLKEVMELTSSINKDYILAEYDLKQSMAHIRALAEAGIVDKKNSAKIEKELEQLLKKIKKDPCYFLGDYEDIHMAVEEELGELGEKLHAGRSRNDQVACDMRMYVRDKIGDIKTNLVAGVNAVRAKIEKDGDMILPAYTHLQRAQAIDLKTYLETFILWFERDIERLKELSKRVNMLPLGAAAGASTGIKLNYGKIAKELGFDGIIKNSMDAVSSRDYILEFVNVLSVMGVHISRLAEDFVIYASREFSFIELDESISDTSSIMPQKKNPDCIELMRSAAGKLIGVQTGLASVVKGLPLMYNRDMQDDKEIFRAVKIAARITGLLPALFNNITFNAERLKDAASDGFTDATDFAEYLVLNGIDFRAAHRKTGLIVKTGLEKGYNMIKSFSLQELQEAVPEVKEDVFNFIDIKEAVKRRMGKEK
ncbi:MAG: argininosuccinate lyase [Elusimicrobia bacterium]|jgi:argininosuccinate lyase|nr:argininosuccinate lyase [Elusimicrobiota bacterium]